MRQLSGHLHTNYEKDLRLLGDKRYHHHKFVTHTFRVRKYIIGENYKYHQESYTCISKEMYRQEQSAAV